MFIRGHSYQLKFVDFFKFSFTLEEFHVNNKVVMPLEMESFFFFNISTLTGFFQSLLASFSRILEGVRLPKIIMLSHVNDSLPRYGRGWSLFYYT